MDCDETLRQKPDCPAKAVYRHQAIDADGLCRDSLPGERFRHVRHVMSLNFPAFGTSLRAATQSVPAAERHAFYFHSQTRYLPFSARSAE